MKGKKKREPGFFLLLFSLTLFFPLALESFLFSRGKGLLFCKIMMTSGG